MGKKKILKDHKQHGKTFSPTLMQYPRLQEVSWVKTILPELLWIALIQDTFGGGTDKVEHITKFTQVCRKHSNNIKQLNFATISSFSMLTVDEQQGVISEISDCNGFSSMRKALLPLISYYPQCPLRFIFSIDYDFLGSSPDLEMLKGTVKKLYDRRSWFGSMVQAIAVWLALESEALIVGGRGDPLLELNEIEKYPNTDLSRQVASSIRATVNSLYGIPFATPNIWPEYFWNRGLEIDGCYARLNGDE